MTTTVLTAPYKLTPDEIQDLRRSITEAKKQRNPVWILEPGWTIQTFPTKAPKKIRMVSVGRKPTHGR